MCQHLTLPNKQQQYWAQSTSAPHITKQTTAVLKAVYVSTSHYQTNNSSTESSLHQHLTLTNKQQQYWTQSTSAPHITKQTTAVLNAVYVSTSHYQTNNSSTERSLRQHLTLPNKQQQYWKQSTSAPHITKQPEQYERSLCQHLTLPNNHSSTERSVGQSRPFLHSVRNNSSSDTGKAARWTASKIQHLAPTTYTKTMLWI